MAYVKEHDTINNSIYQSINSVGKTTATEELQQLVHLDILNHTDVGRGSKYELAVIGR